MCSSNLPSLCKMQQTGSKLSVTPTEKLQVDSEAHVAKTKIFWSQRLASVILSLVMLLVGLGNGWSSPYLAKLSLQESVDGIPRATDDEITWMASLMNIGRIFGAVCGAVAQDTIGRKMSLFWSGIPMLCGWICMTVAVSVQWLYTYRILCGISMGMIWSTISHYLAEIADPEIRGSLASRHTSDKFEHCRDAFECRHVGIEGKSLVEEVKRLGYRSISRLCIQFVLPYAKILWNIACQGIGLFIGNAMGPYISMRTYAYIAIAINLLFLGSFALIPDSPYRHIMEGNLDKAEASLRWFRRSKDVKSELVELQDYVSNSKISFKQRLIEMKQPRYTKSFLLMFLINIFAYFGANNVITNYMEIIITQSQVTVNPSTVVSAIGLCCIVSGLLATLLVDKFGRRVLLIASSLGIAISLTCLGLHFKLLNLGYDPVSLTWLPCTCLLISATSYNAGCGCIPSALVGELFSPALKSIASLSFSGNSAIFSALSTGTFLPFLNLIGPNYLYWLYASGVYVSAIYYYLYLPETMGRSLKDIQKEPK